MFYPAVLNVLKKDPMFPLDRIIPLFFLLVVCFPSDFIYNTMNEEVSNGTLDIISLSKASNIEIMASKITILVLLGG